MWFLKISPSLFCKQSWKPSLRFCWHLRMRMIWKPKARHVTLSLVLWTTHSLSNSVYLGNLLTSFYICGIQNLEYSVQNIRRKTTLRIDRFQKYRMENRVDQRCMNNVVGTRSKLEQGKDIMPLGAIFSTLSLIWANSFNFFCFVESRILWLLKIQMVFMST